MSIEYAWTCKFCEHGNAAGTERCAVCRNPAIARPVDIDPPSAAESTEAERRRKEFAKLPPGVRFAVVALWTVVFIGAIIERFTWSIAAEIVIVSVVLGAALLAVLLSKMWGESPKQGHDA